MAWRGHAGTDGLGMARHATEWHGTAGMARHGMAWHGRHGTARHGMGPIGMGPVSLNFGHVSFNFGHVSFNLTRHGTGCLGTARFLMARHGMARGIPDIGIFRNRQGHFNRALHTF